MSKIVIGRIDLANNRFCDGNRYWMATNLWERSKNLPVFDCPLAALRTGYGIFNGADSIQGLAFHARRVQEASLSYPIILNADGNLMDGGHRIVKALLEGRETIKAVRFEVEPPCDGEEDE